MENYELTDIEEGLNLNKINEKIKKEMEKEDNKPKLKPQNIFVGFKKSKKNPILEFMGASPSIF